MRMLAMVLSVSLVGCSVLTGCTVTWTKPGATQADFNRDNYECERDMRQSNFEGGRHYPGESAGESLGAGMQDFAAGLDRLNFRQQCMVAHGWEKATR